MFVGLAAVLITLQVSQTSFSQTGVKKRGDTSMWTDTPEIIARRNAQGGNSLQQGAAGPLMLTAGAAVLR